LSAKTAPPRICAIIPSYNEEAHVADVVGRSAAHGLDVLVVDDCSKDATGARASAAGAEVLRHETNRGKGAALATGFAWAGERGYEAAVTLDGDGQHDPAEIPRFLACYARTGADIIVGTRMADSAGMPFDRKLTNWFMSAVLSWLAGRRLSDTQSGYRLVRTAAWRRLGLSTSGFDTESEMLVRACRMGMRVREVPVSTIYGDETSSISPGRDFVRWTRLLWRLGHRTRGKAG